MIFWICSIALTRRVTRAVRERKEAAGKSSAIHSTVEPSELRLWLSLWRANLVCTCSNSLGYEHPTVLVLAFPLFFFILLLFLFSFSFFFLGDFGRLRGKTSPACSCGVAPRLLPSCLAGVGIKLQNPTGRGGPSPQQGPKQGPQRRPVRDPNGGSDSILHGDDKPVRLVRPAVALRTSRAGTGNCFVAMAAYRILFHCPLLTPNVKMAPQE